MYLDLVIFNFFHSFAGVHWTLDWLFIFFAEYLPYFVFLGLIYLIIFSNKKWLKRLYFLFLSAFSLLVSRGIIVAGIRFFYHRPRPFLALDFKPLIEPVISSAMPSGHATVFFAVAMLVFFINKKYFWHFLVAAVLISIGRVLVGVHWPSDVLIGALLGIITVLLSKKLLPQP